MKKAFFFAGLAAAALTFVGCNKEADYAGNGTPVEIVLNTVDTRTVNNGLETKWKANDALSVFYAPAGSTDWSENTKFTVTDTEAGLAKGEVSLTAESNDWYLFYPYTLQIPNPKSLAADGSRVGYVYIGSGSNSSQKQTGQMSKCPCESSSVRYPHTGQMYFIITVYSFCERNQSTILLLRFPKRLFFLVSIEGLPQQLVRAGFIPFHRQIRGDPSGLTFAVFISVQNNEILVILYLQASCHNNSFPETGIRIAHHCTAIIPCNGGLFNQ